MSERDDAEALIEPDSASALPSATLARAAGPLPDRAQIRKATDRDIWTLSWPVILSGAMASIVGLADIAMLKSLGTTQLVAVGWATQVHMLAQTVLMAGGVACVAMMSRALGAGELARARAALAACLVLSVGVAAVLYALAAPTFGHILANFRVSAEVVSAAVPYFQLTLASSLLFAVAFSFESAFRATRDTRTPMRLTAVVAATKIGLNYVLIFGALGFPKLGLTGAGWATLGAQVVAVVLFVAASRRSGASEAMRLGWADLRAARSGIRDAVRLSLPAAGERVVMTMGLLSYFAILTRYDEVVIAAYTIGVRLLSFSWIPGMGFASAAATLVGQALGAKDPRQAKRAGWRAARSCVLISLVLGTGCIVFRTPLAELFTDDPAVVAALRPLILMLALSQPFMATHFTLGGGLRGAGDTVTPLVSTMVATWVFRVGIAFVSGQMLDLELIWVWAALVLDHVARSAWLSWAFWRGVWSRQLGATFGERSETGLGIVSAGGRTGDGSAVPGARGSPVGRGH